MLIFILLLLTSFFSYKYYAYLAGKKEGDHIIYYGSNPAILLKYFGNEKGKISFTSKQGCGMFTSLAAYNTHPQMIEAALKAGADVNCSLGEGVTALIGAAFYNSNPEIISILIKAGANVNAVDTPGSTALMLAGRNKNPIASYEMAQLLIKAGADIHIRDHNEATALMYAAVGGNSSLITSLIQAGANVNARNKNGQTALDYAYKYKAPQDVIDVLLKAGAVK